MLIQGQRASNAHDSGIQELEAVSEMQRARADATGDHRPRVRGELQQLQRGGRGPRGVAHGHRGV